MSKDGGLEGDSSQRQAPEENDDGRWRYQSEAVEKLGSDRRDGWRSKVRIESRFGGLIINTIDNYNQ